jgi:hypothetical protein
LAIFAAMLVAAAIGRPGESQTLAPSTDSITTASKFLAVDLFVDPQGKPLAAYQAQVVAKGAEVTLVGVEGGDHPAFSAAPYYDKRAILSRRIVIAAYNTGTILPTGKTRVATLMIRVTGGAQPLFAATLQAAASSDAHAIAAGVSVSIEGNAEGATP